MHSRIRRPGYPALKETLMAKKIDVAAAATVSGSRYPTPFDAPCAGRLRRRLGDAAGLSQFGVNLTRLAPGAWSSQRHWHTAEDEFIYVVEGELVLVTDTGEEILHAGDCAAFKAGNPDGHHLQNRTPRDACFLEIGARRPAQDEVNYPDIDLRALPDRQGYAHRSGEPYPGAKPRNPAADP
jgi:uncharacterized cupin superfamily protein